VGGDKKGKETPGCKRTEAISLFFPEGETAGDPPEEGTRLGSQRNWCGKGEEGVLEVFKRFKEFEEEQNGVETLGRQLKKNQSIEGREGGA